MSKFTPGPVGIIGTVKKCEIGGFIAIGPHDSPPTAYVANRPDAELYAAATDLLAAAKLAHLHFARTYAVGEFLGDDEHEVWEALGRAINKAESK